jgi:GntR family transcriptional regulator
VGEVASVAIGTTIYGLMSQVNEAAEPDIALRAIDRRDPTALHDQVAAVIRRAITDGEAGPGDRMPQARDLAAVLGVNKNTVLRALRLLRQEGLLEMGRGRAIRVTGTPEQTTLLAKTAELIALARTQGYRRDELVALIDQLST